MDYLLYELWEYDEYQESNANHSDENGCLRVLSAGKWPVGGIA